VRVRSATADKACLGELRLLLKGEPVAITPPRQVPGSIKASSVLAPADAFHPGFLFDSRLDFGWAEGDKGPGTGQSFTLTLDAPVELVALELWNGYQRSDDHFRKNARAKSLAVSVDGGLTVSLPVKDASGSQRLALPQPMKGRAWTVRVEDVYPGKSYKDLVLSELRLVDARGPLGVRTADAETRLQALRTRLADSPLGKLVDKPWQAFCDPPGTDSSDRRLKLRTNGTFVFYEDAQEGNETTHRTEVFDGAWVLKKGTAPWTAVELFGRRHRSERSWAPYSDRTRHQESVRIAGGTLEWVRVESLGLAGFKQLVADWARDVQREKVDCFEADEASYQRLVDQQAFFVRGKAITDLFARP